MPSVPYSGWRFRHLGETIFVGIVAILLSGTSFGIICQDWFRFVVVMILLKDHMSGLFEACRGDDSSEGVCFQRVALMQKSGPLLFFRVRMPACQPAVASGRMRELAEAMALAGLVRMLGCCSGT